MAATIQLKDYTDEYGFEYVIGMGNNSGSAISALIDQAQGQKTTLQISSMGGSCYAAIEIINAIKRHGNVHADIQGIAFSAAAVIAAACKTVSAGKYTMFMIHNSRIFAEMWGAFTSDDLKKLAESESQQMDAFDKLQTQVFVTKTGLPENQITEMLAQETWLTGTEARDLGFVDNLSDEEPAAMAQNIYARAMSTAPMRMVAMAGKHFKTDDNMADTAIKEELAEIRKEFRAQAEENKGFWARLFSKDKPAAKAIATEDASQVYIKDGEELTAGTEVFKDEDLKEPVEDSNIALNTGEQVFVEEGKVKEVKATETIAAENDRIAALEQQVTQLTALTKEQNALIAKSNKKLSALADVQSTFEPEGRKKEFASNEPADKKAGLTPQAIAAAREELKKNKNKRS